MKIKIHSSELNRMMKTVTQCIDQKGNVEIIHDNNLLSIRGTNGTMSAVMSTPLLGGDGEVFCVDGTMFARVCAICGGEIEISTDGKNCTVRGVGRTRLPIVDAHIPAFGHVRGKTCLMRAEDFSRGYSSVSYAISQDMTRVVLMGVLMERYGEGVRMVALDGFKMSMEYIDCEADDMRVVIPSAFMKLVSNSTVSGENLRIETDGHRIQASTDSMFLSCTLLAGEYPDCDRITPDGFKAEVYVRTDDLRNALKSGAVVNQDNMVKLVTGEDYLRIMSNSEKADFVADIECKGIGDILKIAFDHRFLMETIGSVSDEMITLKFTTPVSPCIVEGKDTNGFRLLLPVRTAG